MPLRDMGDVCKKEYQQKNEYKYISFTYEDKEGDVVFL